jgi:hypothetical protein
MNAGWSVLVEFQSAINMMLCFCSKQKDVTINVWQPDDCRTTSVAVSEIIQSVKRIKTLLNTGPQTSETALSFSCTAGKQAVIWPSEVQTLILISRNSTFLYCGAFV